MARPILRFLVIPLAFGVACASHAAEPAAAVGPASFDELMKLDVPDADRVAPIGGKILPVREAALREAAVALGTQWGMHDRSIKVIAEINAVATEYDRRFSFGSLMMGVGFLPPVISEARNARMIQGRVLKTAEGIYQFDEPPRPVIVVPTWRDWLLLGLNADAVPVMPTARSLYPRDADELAYYRKVLSRSYQEGVDQVNDVFAANLARLTRTYDGMRRFYKLYKAGMVTAPVIASALTVADTSDPNVLVVGNTVIRVVVDAKFVGNTDKWVPLGQ